MNKLCKRMAVSILASCLIISLAQTASAGGSSYAFYTYSRTGVVGAGHTFPDAFQLNLQTYINSKVYNVNQISINSIKISCLGDNALEKAHLRLGYNVLASSDFVPSSLAPRWYKAVIEPEGLIIENQSGYNFSIDLQARPNLQNSQVSICKAEIIEHRLMHNGEELKDPNYGMLSSLQEQEAMIVTTSADYFFGDSRGYRNIKLEYNTFNPPLTLRGTISKIDTRQYQVSVSKSDAVKMGLYNVLLPYNDSPTFKFDITWPTFFNSEEMRSYASSFQIQEFHLYPEISEDGAVGKVTLKRY